MKIELQRRGRKSASLVELEFTVNLGRQKTLECSLLLLFVAFNVDCEPSFECRSGRRWSDLFEHAATLRVESGCSLKEGEFWGILDALQSPWL